MHFNIILPSTSSSCKWSLPVRYSEENFVFISLYTLQRIFITGIRRNVRRNYLVVFF